VFHSAERNLHFLDVGCAQRTGTVATWSRRALNGAIEYCTQDLLL